ncbi:hypothetical protein V8E36_009650 [Tilletia maclaganii]
MIEDISKYYRETSEINAAASVQLANALAEYFNGWEHEYLPPEPKVRHIKIADPHDSSLSRALAQKKSTPHRSVRACIKCRTRKMKCSGQHPCDKCNASGDICAYEEKPRRSSSTQASRSMSKEMETSDKEALAKSAGARALKTTAFSFTSAASTSATTEDVPFSSSLSPSLDAASTPTTTMEQSHTSTRKRSLTAALTDERPPSQTGRRIRPKKSKQPVKQESSSNTSTTVGHRAPADKDSPKTFHHTNDADTFWTPTLFHSFPAQNNNSPISYTLSRATTHVGGQPSHIFQLPHGLGLPPAPLTQPFGSESPETPTFSANAGDSQQSSSSMLMMMSSPQEQMQSSFSSLQLDHNDQQLHQTHHQQGEDDQHRNMLPLRLGPVAPSSAAATSSSELKGASPSPTSTIFPHSASPFYPRGFAPFGPTSSCVREGASFAKDYEAFAGGGFHAAHAHALDQGAGAGATMAAPEQDSMTDRQPRERMEQVAREGYDDSVAYPLPPGLGPIYDSSTSFSTEGHSSFGSDSITPLKYGALLPAASLPAASWATSSTMLSTGNGVGEKEQLQGEEQENIDGQRFQPFTPEKEQGGGVVVVEDEEDVDADGSSISSSGGWKTPTRARAAGASAAKTTPMMLDKMMNPGRSPRSVAGNLTNGKSYGHSDRDGGGGGKGCEHGSVPGSRSMYTHDWLHRGGWPAEVDEETDDEGESESEGRLTPRPLLRRTSGVGAGIGAAQHPAGLMMMDSPSHASASAARFGSGSSSMAMTTGFRPRSESLLGRTHLPLGLSVPPAHASFIMAAPPLPPILGGATTSASSLDRLCSSAKPSSL